MNMDPLLREPTYIPNSGFVWLINDEGVWFCLLLSDSTSVFGYAGPYDYARNVMKAFNVGGGVQCERRQWPCIVDIVYLSIESSAQAIRRLIALVNVELEDLPGIGAIELPSHARNCTIIPQVTDRIALCYGVRYAQRRLESLVQLSELCNGTFASDSKESLIAARWGGRA